jgi:hypothetical protein
MLILERSCCMQNEIFDTTCTYTVWVARAVSFLIWVRGQTGLRTAVLKNSHITEGHLLYDCLPSVTWKPARRIHRNSHLVCRETAM